MQEGGWTQYPTFTELHQILYRSESNLYENFVLPPGITAGDDGSHVNDKTMAMFRKVLGRPAKFIVEVRRFFPHLPPSSIVAPRGCPLHCWRTVDIQLCRCS